MSQSDVKLYKSYKWIVKDPDYLNDHLAIKGTRMPITLVLQCLAEGMTYEEICESYIFFPKEALQEVMGISAEMIEKNHVAA